MNGWNLTDILMKRDELFIFWNPERIKNILWQIMGLLIGGQCYSNLIVSNDNLFF